MPWGRGAAPSGQRPEPGGGKVQVQNAEIAAVFYEIADLLEIENSNPFRIRAYRNAARTVQMLAPNVQALVEAGRDLKELPGIGIELAERIAEVAEGGTCELREQLRRELPPEIHRLLRIPGLGPKRVRLLYQERGIHTPEQLLRAAREGQLRTIRGLGEKTEQRILEVVQAQLSSERRFSIADAADMVEPLIGYLQELAATGRVEAAGSYRRMKETVGDLDIVATSASTEQVTQHFVSYGLVAKVLSQGPTRASVELRNGMQVDLRVVAEPSFGAALHYFTGSKNHNIEVRKLAQKRGLKLNEYGMFSGETPVAGETEEAVFTAVGLAFIEPELRENRGEIEAARDGRLPQLVALTDLKGDLHSHTTASDGRNSLREMAMAAQGRGMAYLGITEHSNSAGIARGLDAEQLARHIDDIDKLNAGLDGITLLKGVEVDILEDGRLDLPDSILRQLDYAIGSVHSKFELTREAQTTRIMRAMDNPNIRILGHPIGRLLFVRQPYEVDMGRIIRHAKQCGCVLELDSQPGRLDLNDSYCMLAKDEGVLISIDSDAHSTEDFDNLRFGVGQGRRGWLEKGDVLNTRTLEQVMLVLRERR
ncbi:MAG: DNA polymerase/3'-5' exonuclease PolX [Massilia sp.]